MHIEPRIYVQPPGADNDIQLRNVILSEAVGEVEGSLLYLVRILRLAALAQNDKKTNEMTLPGIGGCFDQISMITGRIMGLRLVVL